LFYRHNLISSNRLRSGAIVMSSVLDYGIRNWSHGLIALINNHGELNCHYVYENPKILGDCQEDLFREAYHLNSCLKQSFDLPVIDMPAGHPQ